MFEKKKKAKKVRPENLAAALASITRTYGQGAVMKGRGMIANVESWPTGVASFDVALGCGGIPRGRVIEIFGTESSGKTTLSLTAVASCQNTEFTRRGDGRRGVCAFIDAEHALDPVWATRIGVDMDQLILSQPSSGEEALDICDKLVQCGDVDLIVVDSVASLVPQEELDGEISDHNVGAQARLMSKSLRRISAECAKMGTTVIFINQLREKIGIMFGSSETTPGGRALKFYSSIRVDVRGKEFLEENKRKIGRTFGAKIVKNKVGRPFTYAEYNIMFGEPHSPIYGVDKMNNLLQLALEYQVVERRSSTYSYGSLRASGADNFIALLSQEIEKNPALLAELREKTYTKVLGEQPPGPLQDETDEEILDALGEDEDEDEDDD